jgi:hypothetical protein
MVLAAFLLGLPMLGSTVAFAAITSLATIGLYISEWYYMITKPQRYLLGHALTALLEESSGWQLSLQAAQVGQGHLPMLESAQLFLCSHPVSDLGVSNVLSKSRNTFT